MYFVRKITKYFWVWKNNKYLCNNMNRIHVISFQNPCPPTFGGAIDVYYKLLALKRAGWHVTLHTFCYGDRSGSPDAGIADEIHTYDRHTGILSNMSALPYIVNSRRSKTLVDNLLTDKTPILFEGLHTCYPLADPRLADRTKIVRAHNVEHDYYRGLARASRSWRERLYFNLEANKLEQFEPILGHADAIAAISQADRDYFAARYPSVKSLLMPCFFDITPPANLPGSGNYVLYQGNLAVKENILAARWIIDHVAWHMPHVKFIIAGSSPHRSLERMASSAANVTLIANPDSNQFEQLLNEARVNLLITFQPTGIKLKLLNALCRGAHIVTNTAMVAGTGLENYVDTADTTVDITAAIDRLMETPFTWESRKPLPDIYNPDINIAILGDCLKTIS